MAACRGAESTGGITAEGPPPNVLAGAPILAAGDAHTIEVAFSDAAGADKILIVQLMIAPKLDSQKSCWMEYSPGQKTVRMMDGSAQAKAGDAASLSNGQCSIDAAQVKHTIEGNTLKVSIPVKMAAPVEEVQNIFALASAATEHSGWQTVGSWAPQSGAAK